MAKDVLKYNNWDSHLGISYAKGLLRHVIQVTFSNSLDKIKKITTVKVKEVWIPGVN